MSVTGILPLNKPVGVRSTACVAAVRRVLGRKNKVGHGGTLDSTADGVLVLLVGAATRLSSLIMSMPKRYETTVQLGISTDTDDAGGTMIEKKDWNHVTDGDIDRLLPHFYGWRMQTPPAISAVKVGGERSHRLARSGVKVKITPRPVYFLSTKRISPLNADGRVKLSVLCSKGTYIRSFARDLGDMLGTVAHVSALTRVESGPFKLGRTVKFEEASEMGFEELAKTLLPVDVLSGYVNAYSASDEEVRAVVNGQAKKISSLRRKNFSSSPMAMDTAVISAKGIFSVCSTEPFGATMKLSPNTNIFYEGADNQ
jgi:tRNA pseudouridine55 synthase